MKPAIKSLNRLLLVYKEHHTNYTIMIIPISSAKSMSIGYPHPPSKKASCHPLPTSDCHNLQSFHSLSSSPLSLISHCKHRYTHTWNHISSLITHSPASSYALAACPYALSLLPRPKCRELYLWFSWATVTQVLFFWWSVLTSPCLRIRNWSCWVCSFSRIQGSRLYHALLRHRLVLSCCWGRTWLLHCHWLSNNPYNFHKSWSSPFTDLFFFRETSDKNHC